MNWEPGSRNREVGTVDTRTGNINMSLMEAAPLVHCDSLGLDMPKIDMSTTAEIKRSASSPRSYSGRDGPGYEEVFPTQMVAG